MTMKNPYAELGILIKNPKITVTTKRNGKYHQVDFALTPREFLALKIGDREVGKEFTERAKAIKEGSFEWKLFCFVNSIVSKFKKPQAA